jgi:hypothetical protein
MGSAICRNIKALLQVIRLLYIGFARGSPRSVHLTFFQSYVKYDLRKNKIVVSFFCQLINFYKLIVMF